MMRIFLLLMLSAPFFGVVATTINGKLGTPVPTNTEFATAAAEATVTIQVTPGHPVTYEFVNDGGETRANAQAWYVRTTAGDAATGKYIAADQAFRLRFTVTTTIYVHRSTADGTVTATLLLQE
jgi:hypothetical protein